MNSRIVALLVAVVLVLTACADVTGAALEVNGETFDRSELVDIVTDVRDEAVEADIAFPVEPGPGSIPSDVSTQVISIFIQNEIMGQELRSQSLDVTGDEIDAAFSEVSGVPTFDALVAEWNARAEALEAEGTDFSGLFVDAEVELDPRFGVWVGTQAQVFPS